MLENPDRRNATVAESQEHARERLSFEALHSQLTRFFALLHGTTASLPRQSAAPRQLTRARHKSHKRSTTSPRSALR
jgi:hypothetical protein